MKNEHTISMGLTTVEARKRHDRFGPNELVPRKKENFLSKILHVLSEPMFLLLMAAAVIYFVLGKPRDGLIMLVFVVGIIGIEVVQEWKTDKTLNSLKHLFTPQVRVIRDGKETLILASELVPGDIMLIQEGVKIPADGIVIRQNDLCVDESSLTGEAQGVWKTEEEETTLSDDFWRKDYCYAGTLVTQGTAVVLIDKIGTATEYGKIGAMVAEAPKKTTPLQKQTRSLVRTCVIIAAALFVLVGIVTWQNISDHAFGDRLTESILSGIALAMATIPEEFPVILTVFLSMGAWRLAKKKSLVRHLPSVETLGAVSVLCVDKTGTITMNQMAVQEVWTADHDKSNLVHMMGLACETDAYDPMEKAMLGYCEKEGIPETHLFKGELLDEYTFTNELKMMGHVWYHDNEIIIAAKGSPESILPLCNLIGPKLLQAESRVQKMSAQGLRVIAIASAKPKDKSGIPDVITECELTLNGFVGLADPPRKSVKKDIESCTGAGIRTVMITGDNGITAAAIAKQIGMKGYDSIITGNMLENMDDAELLEKVKTVSIFSRVLPEHKTRIVKAFKESGEIVAMTGDGVNDASALKYADIGISMGGRGCEAAREAADLILMDDNFSTIVDTIKDGRRIFDNIRKAVGYVFAIHIPIAAASLLAPFLGIAPNCLLLLPLHVVLLELIIDPTCSIVLERQPPESDIMQRNPRNPKKKLLDSGLILKSILQGGTIFAASFGAYYTTMAGSPNHAPTGRSMGLSVIMLANLFLVQVNSSDHDYIFTTIKKIAKDHVMWAVNIFTLLGLIIILYSPLNGILKLAPLSARQILIAFTLSASSVLWYEVVKLIWKVKIRIEK